ncbi:MAG: hypothetical protein FD167_1916 [bacterium]|nr:MAG: hypothetical protein FD167_1916 [bacterium]
MSQKKTKPRVKSAKADLPIENASVLESPIRSSPATRALRFLLGKDPYPSISDIEQENNLNSLDASLDKAEDLISTQNGSISTPISVIRSQARST